MNMSVKFLLNYFSVTNSSFFLVSSPFFVIDGDKGDEGEAELGSRPSLLRK